MIPRDSALAAGQSFRGRITGPGGLVVGGELYGEVHIQGTLEILPGGAVRGEVHARRMVVAGLFDGHAQASEQLSLTSTARFFGIGEGGLLLVADGARVEGELRGPGGRPKTREHAPPPKPEPKPKPKKPKRSRTKGRTTNLRMPRLRDLEVRRG